MVRECTVNTLSEKIELLSFGCLTIIFFFGGLIGVITILLALIFGNIYIRTLCVLYLIFYYFDFDTSRKGGRGIGYKWFRDLIMWKNAINYLHHDVVKTAELSLDRNYLIAACPHGIISYGVVLCGATNHSKWHSLFPGIRSKVVTLSLNLMFPLYRECLLNWGFSDASAENLNYLLSQSNDPTDETNKDGYTSNALFLLFGGAQEAFYSAPQTYKIYLNARKGFVRIAIQNGAGLVPAITFGETNVYDTSQNENGSFLRKMQELIKKYTTVAPVFFNGRGIFQQRFGLIPKRRPLTLVIGEPINCEQNASPTTEQIDEIHSLFRQRLIDLFETHKCKYIDNHEKIHLEII